MIAVVIQFMIAIPRIKLLYYIRHKIAKNIFLIYCVFHIIFRIIGYLTQTAPFLWSLHEMRV